MNRRLALILFVISVVLVVFFLGFRINPVGYAEQALTARIAHLQILDKQLAEGLTPENADIAIGISESGLSAALASLIGVRAQSTDIDGVELEVVSAQAQFEPGMLRLMLGIKAQHEQVAEIEFTATGLLLLESIDRQAATYQPQVTAVEAKMQTGIFSIQTRTWVSEILASNLVQQFAQELTFELPLAHPLVQTMGVDKEERTDVNNDKHGHIGHYVTNTHMDKSTLLADEDLRLLPPLVTSETLWVLGIIQRSSTEEVPPPAESTPSMAELERLQQRIAERTQAFPLPIADLEFRLNRSSIDHALNTFNSLPQKNRRVITKLTEREGHFAKDYNKDALLGDGGYYANFKTDDSAKAQLDLLPIETTWQDSGARFVTQLAVSASADLKLHLDPYVGGGFSTLFTIKGESRVPIMMRLEARQLRLSDAHTVAVIGPVIECTEFPITLSGGGEIKLGVTMHELVGEEQAEPYVLLSSAHVYPSKVLEATSEGALLHDEYWSEVTLSPTLSQANAQGYRVAANVSASLHHGQRENKEEESEGPALTQEIETLWKQQVQGKCPTPKGIIVHFAGQDFGPNNEIVKALKALAVGLNTMGKNLEVAGERLDTVISDPSKTPEVLGDIAKDAGNVLTDAVKDVGKAIEDAAKWIGDRLKW